MCPRSAGWPAWLSALLLLLALDGAASADLLSFSGRVLDENRTPLNGVEITLRAHPSGPAYTALSNPSGRFQILLLPGRYQLSAQRQGYFTLRNREVDIDASAAEIELVLPRLQPNSESINVLAHSPEVDSQETTAARRLTGREILDVPYPATRDFRNALRLIPGVVQHPAGLSFQGARENQMLYTLNGFNIGDPVTGRLTARIPVESVRSVEYLVGRYPASYGKGSGGAVAVETNTGDDQFRYSATNFVPGIETQKGLHIGTWAPRVNFSGPLRRGRAWFANSTDSEYSVAVIRDLPPGQDRIKRWRTADVLHTQVNLTPSQQLSSDALVAYERAPRTGLSPLDPVSTTVDRMLRHYFASLKYQKYFARGMLLELGYARTNILRREQPQGDSFYIITPEGRHGNYFAHTVQRSGRDQLLMQLFAPPIQLAGPHQLKVGLDLDRVQLRQSTLRSGFMHFNRFGKLLSQTTFGGPNALALSNFQAAAYVADTWQPRRSLSLEYGLRQDRDQLTGSSAISVRASAATQPWQSLPLRFAGGLAVAHDPSPLDLFSRARDQYSLTTYYDSAGWALGPPVQTIFRAGQGYRLPRAQSLSVGWEYQLLQNLQLSASLVRRRTSRGFLYLATPADDPALHVFTLENLRLDTYEALGLTIHHRFGKDYEWMASYTRSSARSNSVIDFSVDQWLRVPNNLGPLPWDVPHRLLSWGYLPGWNDKWAFSYLLDLRSGFPFSVVRDSGEIVGPVNSWRFPVNFSLNIHLERKLRLGRYRFALRAGINNVANAANPSAVNNVIDSPRFLRYYGREGRHAVFRLRWLKPQD